MAKNHTLLVAEYFIVLSIYLVLGGGVLHGLERDTEIREIEKEQEIVGRAQLSKFQMDLLSKNDICKFRTTDDREWTFSGATFFSLTVVTTIGYGHVTPMTTGGKLFTLIYSIIGIGLVAHILKRMTKAVFRGCSYLYSKITGKVQNNKNLINDDGALIEGERERADITFSRFDVDGNGTIDLQELGLFLEALSGEKVEPLVTNYVMNEADTDPDGVLTREEMVQAVTVFYALQRELPRSVRYVTILAAGVVVFSWIFAWAAAFSAQEDWNYWEGFWYCYVTLTTIGFGDYHPKSDKGRIMAFLFIIPGLSVVGWFISSVFRASQAKRFWLMQRAYANGKISARVLEAQGIKPLAIKKKPEDCAVKSEKSSVSQLEINLTSTATIPMSEVGVQGGSAASNVSGISSYSRQSNRPAELDTYFSQDPVSPSRMGPPRREARGRGRPSPNNSYSLFTPTPTPQNQYSPVNRNFLSSPDDNRIPDNTSFVSDSSYTLVNSVSVNGRSPKSPVDGAVRTSLRQFPPNIST
eukprot:TRINITY_DN3019_c2_g1_i1.p1 TRINITY_DN3019_c2_g1~~TRINITY_DN3019_c2_g1_i1.p1  ORF type:complete len:525 (+),score=83.31 TRINITY_DN3019_c2_g1_i1:54-1628(+)